MTEPDAPIEAGLRRLGIMLSPVLRYVLAMVCRGSTDDEIAETLGVARRTINAYVKRLFTSTGTTNRTALVGAILANKSHLQREESAARKAWLSSTTRRSKP